MTLISTYLISLAYKNVKFLLKHKWVNSLRFGENCACPTNRFTCPGLSGSRICPILPLKNCCDDIESLTLLKLMCGQQNTLVSGVISRAAKCYWISVFCYWNYTFHTGIFMKFWPKYWNLSLISQLFPHKNAKTCVKVCKNRHSENFWAFTGPRIDFGLILLISNMIIHMSFTGPTHLLSSNVRGPVSFAVSAKNSEIIAICDWNEFPDVGSPASGHLQPWYSGLIS